MERAGRVRTASREDSVNPQERAGSGPGQDRCLDPIQAFPASKIRGSDARLSHWIQGETGSSSVESSFTTGLSLHAVSCDPMALVVACRLVCKRPHRFPDAAEIFWPIRKLCMPRRFRSALVAKKSFSNVPRQTTMMEVTIHPEDAAVTHPFRRADAVEQSRVLAFATGRNPTYQAAEARSRMVQDADRRPQARVVTVSRPVGGRQRN